ncbi:MAG: hypothetical protein HUU02_10265 [Bacteroidetes bacterium]|nr:hypothetical protein [Bacteroidota bacterium]
MPRAIVSFVFVLVVGAAPLSSQTHIWADSSGYPLIHITAGYSLNSRNAEKANMDFHKQENLVEANQFTLRSNVVEPTTEYLVTVSVRPEGDHKILNLRIGEIRNSFRFTTTMSTILPDGTPAGSMVVVSEEQYQVIPVSIGASVSTIPPLLHVYADAIYAWATMTEVQSYSLNDGPSIPLTSSTFTSASGGFRIGGGITFSFTKRTAIVLDLGYRGLGFYSFYRENGSSSGLDYTISGMYGMIGLSFGL